MHSCFLVELDDRYLLFDYFDKTAVPEIGFDGCLPELDDKKMLYVFSSHGHKDHFSLEVLHWASHRDKIHYILSKHIRLGLNYLKRNGLDESIKSKITFVSARNEYKVDDMKITTLRSTDEGVAFLVETNGECIYHAGDLSWWGSFERGELYTEAIGRAYRGEIKQLINKHINYAFVVLDPRMDDAYYLGLDYFVKNIDVDLIFPMHMWRNYDRIKDFKRRPDLGRLADKIVDIDRENLIFDIE